MTPAEILCALFGLWCQPAQAHSLGVEAFEVSPPPRRWCLSMRDAPSGKMTRVVDTYDAQAFVKNWLYLASEGVSPDEMNLRCVTVPQAANWRK